MCEATTKPTSTKVTAQMPLNPPTTVVEGRPIASAIPSTAIVNVHKDSSSNTKPLAPSFAARYTCAGGMVAIFAAWGQWTFGVVQDAANVPVGDKIHSWTVPAGLCLFYLVSLPVLKALCQRYLWNTVDVRALLTEAMVVYNAGQVLLNGWMVYRIIDSLIYNDHPFIRGTGDLVTTGTTYAVWVHYCDKYLEFMDTYFMVLRGKMDQVSFLHVYHHVSISLAWWFALWASPGGDSYFGALVNSWIHVMMYSYYTLALLKIACPWKRYLTQAQLLQFVSVVGYTIVCYTLQPAGTWVMPYLVQLFEMLSLLVLFLHFYRKAYRNRQESKRSESATSTVPVNAVDTSDDEPDTVSSTSSEGVSSDDGDE